MTLLAMSNEGSKGVHIAHKDANSGRFKEEIVEYMSRPYLNMICSIGLYLCNLGVLRKQKISQFWGLEFYRLYCLLEKNITPHCSKRSDDPNIWQFWGLELSVSLLGSAFYACVLYTLILSLV